MARLGYDGFPVGVRFNSHELRHVTDPGEPNPAMLGAVGTQQEEQLTPADCRHEPAAEMYELD